MATPEQFARRISQLGERVVRETDRIVRRSALAADQAVVIGTPVDTGRAKSNWLVAIDAPARTTIPAYDPGEKGSTSGSNTSAALAQGRIAIRGYQGGINRAIAISNNLDYIGELNDGSSRQAPKRFVQKAVQAAVARVKASRLF